MTSNLEILDYCTQGNWVRAVISAMPAWFRFAQCLRRYKDTKHVFPHLVNAGKYSTTLLTPLKSRKSLRKNPLTQWGTFLKSPIQGLQIDVLGCSLGVPVREIAIKAIKGHKVKSCQIELKLIPSNLEVAHSIPTNF